MYNVPLFFFDLETTGLDVDTDGIVQLAYKKFDVEDADGNRWETSESLVLNPLQPISPQAAAVHGFTDEDVADKPTFEVYADSLFGLADGAVWCGYNIYNFDIPIFKNEFKRVGKKAPKPAGIIDCYKIFTHYYGASRKRGERTLMAAHRRYCGCAFDNAHDALADIEATYDVLDAQIDVHCDTLTLEYAMAVSNKRDLKIDSRGFFRFDGHSHKAVCCMGKYAGVPIDKVPDSYLSWIAGNEGFPADTRRIATQALIGVYPTWR